MRLTSREDPSRHRLAAFRSSYPSRAGGRKPTSRKETMSEHFHTVETAKGPVRFVRTGEPIVEIPVSTLKAGTYARESGGSALLFHSPHRFNDAAENLRNWRDSHGSPAGPHNWRRVDSADERTAVLHLCGELSPGEYVEV